MSYSVYRGRNSQTASIISIKCSRAEGRVKMRRFTDVSGTDSISVFRVLLMAWYKQVSVLSGLKMVTQSVPKTWEIFTSGRGSAREHFIDFAAKSSRLKTSINQFGVVCTVHHPTIRIKTNRMQNILVIRLYFLLDALHVSDYISPSSGATL